MTEKVDKKLLRSVGISTPLGTFRVIGLRENYLKILLPGSILSDYDLCMSLSPNEDYPLLRETVEFLQDYFKGVRATWKGDFIPDSTRFMSSVWRTAAEIPFGETVSYGELAALSGYPGAARAVGSAMARNPLPILIPCHRVIKSDGSLGGYGGGLDMKMWLLEHEGVKMR